jgi:uncharacterized delta-60 repeat protein
VQYLSLAISSGATFSITAFIKKLIAVVFCFMTRLLFLAGIFFIASCGFFRGTITRFGKPTSATANTITKFIVGGSFTSYNGTPEFSIARINSDGSLDTTFAPTGTGLSAQVNALSIDSSGKIIVGGAFTSYNGTNEFRIARINNNGSLDTTFSPTGTGLNGTVNALTIDSSGKIIVGGAFANYNGTSEPRIARLNTDGSLDATFAPTGTGLGFTVRAVAIDSSGKIIVGGAFGDYNGTNEFYVARLNTDGSLDGTFNPVGTGLSGGTTVNALAIDASGKIVVGGQFNDYNGTNEFNVARLNTNGSLDATFAPTGTGLNSDVKTLIIDSSGKIIVGGNATSYNGTSEPYIARLNTDGSLDTSFGPTGSGFDSTVLGLALDSSGKIMATGFMSSYDIYNIFNLARLNPDGSLDTSLLPTGTGFNSVARAISVVYSAQ